MSRNKKLQNLASGSGSLGTTFQPPKPPSFAKAVLEAYVKASNTGVHDVFSRSVAVDSDTLVVGAHWEDSGATGINGDQADNSTVNSGAVYVFTRTNGAWSQQVYLKASNTGAHDWFGFSVALSSNTLVIGAPQESSNATGINSTQSDNSAANSGACYVFTRTNGVWSQQAYLKASNTGAGDLFGKSVALDGNTLVVGAEEESSNATGINGNQANNGAPKSGACYVFTRTNGVWSQQAYLKASNTGAGDLFGKSVVLDGDRLVVGAPSESSNATGINGNQADNSTVNSGAVYVFTRTNGVWSQQAYLKASNTTVGMDFGKAVALSGNTVVVGAPGEASSATGINGNQMDNSASGSGAVYVFKRPTAMTVAQEMLNTWSQQAYVKASNTGGQDFFGDSVAVSGQTVVVGAPGEASSATGINGNQMDNSASVSGAVYVYRAK